MRCVRLRLDAGGREADIHPMYDVLANADFVERATAVQWSFTPDSQAFLHYVEGDVDAFRETTAAIPEVLAVAATPAGNGAFYAYVRGVNTAGMRELFEALVGATTIPVPPIRYHADGTVSYSIVGPADEIQAGLESVPAPIEVAVEAVGGLAEVARFPETALSPRQREAMETGLALGYYEVPREAGHEAVAEAMDCAPSTAAEHLRKAEATLVRSVFG